MFTVVIYSERFHVVGCFVNLFNISCVRMCCCCFVVVVVVCVCVCVCVCFFLRVCFLNANLVLQFKERTHDRSLPGCRYINNHAGDTDDTDDCVLVRGENPAVLLGDHMTTSHATPAIYVLYPVHSNLCFDPRTYQFKRTITTSSLSVCITFHIISAAH